MVKNGNVLGELRRGTQGTAIGEIYPIDTDVVDIGHEETIPYNEHQIRMDFVSDGSTLLVGPLDFVPLKGVRQGTWYRDTIPEDFGPCDQLEVFAAGKRLRKDPLRVWSENNGAYSPAADESLEAEFSVNGEVNSLGIISGSPYIRLTNPLPAGRRITIIKRTGNLWYERGENTASKGISLLKNNTAIAKFIADKSTDLPE